jgi:hypothetical protein
MSLTARIPNANVAAAAINALRADRERLAAERATLAQTRVPRAVAVARIEQHLAARAAGFVPPPIAGYVAPDFDDFLVERSPLFHESDFDALVCLLLAERIGPLMIQGLDAYRAANPSPELTDKQRIEKLAAIDAKLLALEIDEEQAIRRAEASGHPIDRRGDADPGVVLAAKL